MKQQIDGTDNKQSKDFHQNGNIFYIYTMKKYNGTLIFF